MLTVIELKNCGNHSGLFQTREGAKQAAQELLDSYHEMWDELDAEEQEDTQPLTTDTLSWSVERIDHHGLITEHPDLGWEAEVAFYSERNGYFTLHEVEVQP